MPWINHLPPVCWSTFGILAWNDSVYVNLTQWWYFFIIFEYILHISTPHIMVFCFPLPYFPLSTSALFFAKYSCTHIVYRRSLVTFYSILFYSIRKGPFHNNPALVQIMAWRRSGDKPLSEPMMISLQTYICVTRPQWVNQLGKLHELYIYVYFNIYQYSIDKS